MQKLLIEVAVNETVTKAENPHTPYTPEEIAEDAYQCYRAGAIRFAHHILRVWVRGFGAFGVLGGSARSRSATYGHRSEAEPR